MNEEKEVNIIKYNHDHYRVVYNFEICTEKWEEDLKAWKNGLEALEKNIREVEDGM